MELNNLVADSNPSIDVANSNAMANNNYLDDVERLSLEDEDDITSNLSRATLSLARVGDPDYPQKVSLTTTNSSNGNISLERRQSQTSTTSITSSTDTNRSSQTNDSNNFLAIRNGALEVAAQLCKPILFKDTDGNLLGFWLLTEISSWDVERERLFYLTEKSLIVIKFDFANMRLLEYKRHALKSFDCIAMGELKYPLGSLVPSRNQVGIRCMWNKGQEISATIKWNPFRDDIPWLTITSHPLLSSRDIDHRQSYDVDHFSKTLLNQIEREQLKDNCQLIKLINAPIMIENYAGFVSAIANVSSLGFFKSRGKMINF